MLSFEQMAPQPPHPVLLCAEGGVGGAGFGFDGGNSLSDDGKPRAVCPAFHADTSEYVASVTQQRPSRSSSRLAGHRVTAVPAASIGSTPLSLA